MEKEQLITKLSETTKVSSEEAEKALNEIVGEAVLPNVFRPAIEKKITAITRLDEGKVNLIMNEAIGLLTVRPSVFEHLTARIGSGLAAANSCNGCGGVC